eukprot:GHVP01019718.1.p1 GENE.GHVP01019718.1~~GHVP01019718.1.p1  ORF type:complete len:1434 (+),score=327.00 GHVP01019718.1:429-4730(+)
MRESSKEEWKEPAQHYVRRRFPVGSWVLAAVMRSEDTVILTIRPSVINAGIEPTKILSGMTLQASIQSFEDHGFLCSLGVKDFRLFVPNEENVENQFIKERPRLGDVIITTVMKPASAAKIIFCKEGFSPETEPIPHNSTLPATSLKPGMLVKANVRTISTSTNLNAEQEVVDGLPSGAVLSFLSTFYGGVGIQYLQNPEYLPKKKKSKKVKEDDENEDTEMTKELTVDNILPARVICILPNSYAFLSILPHHLELHNNIYDWLKVQKASGKDSHFLNIPSGTILDMCKFTVSEKKVGGIMRVENPFIEKEKLTLFMQAGHSVEPSMKIDGRGLKTKVLHVNPYDMMLYVGNSLAVMHGLAKEKSGGVKKSEKPAAKTTVNDEPGFEIVKDDPTGLSLVELPDAVSQAPRPTFEMLNLKELEEVLGDVKEQELEKRLHLIFEHLKEFTARHWIAFLSAERFKQSGLASGGIMQKAVFLSITQKQIEGCLMVIFSDGTTWPFPRKSSASVAFLPKAHLGDDEAKIDEEWSKLLKLEKKMKKETPLEKISPLDINLVVLEPEFLVSLFFSDPESPRSETSMPVVSAKPFLLESAQNNTFIRHSGRMEYTKFPASPVCAYVQKNSLGGALISLGNPKVTGFCPLMTQRKEFKVGETIKGFVRDVKRHPYTKYLSFVFVEQKPSANAALVGSGDENDVSISSQVKSVAKLVSAEAEFEPPITTEKLKSWLQKNIKLNSTHLAKYIEPVIPGEDDTTKEFYLLFRIVPWNIACRVDITEVTDNWKSNPHILLEKGEEMDLKIIHISEIPSTSLGSHSTLGFLLHGSLRLSQLANVPEGAKEKRVQSVEDLAEGSITRGIISQSTAKGVFISLGWKVHCRVLLKHLCGEFVRHGEVYKKFPPGTYIPRVKIIKVETSNERTALIGSLKHRDAFNEVLDGEEKGTFSDLKVNMPIVCRIHKKLDGKGLVLDIKNNRQNAFCRLTEISEPAEVDSDTVPVPFESLQEGDIVRAVIEKLDDEKNKVFVSLKPSKVAKARDNFVEEREEEMEEAEEEDESMENTENIETPKNGKMKFEDLVSLFDDKETKEPTTPSSTKSSRKRNAEEATTASESGTPEKPAKAKKAKNEKKLEKPIFKEPIAAPIITENPGGPAEFERLLLSFKDTAVVWIRYISHYLQLNEMTMARQVSERALKEINPEAEEERRNIFIARLNMEAEFGTFQIFKEILTRATNHHDSPLMFWKGITTLVAAKKFAFAEEIIKEGIKKCSDSYLFWSKLLETMFHLSSEPDLTEEERKSYVTRVKEHFAKAIKSLTVKNDRIRLQCDFGRLKIKNFQQEEGFEEFETLLHKYPKRLDLWNQYFDAIEKFSSPGAPKLEAMRRVFDLALSQKMKLRTAKAIFTRYLEFERIHGSQTDVEAVKEKVRNFLESLGGDEGKDEEEE